MGIRITSILACPNCNYRLKRSSSSFSCTHCGKKYQIRDGIPSFLRDVKKQDISLSKDKWESIYQTGEQGDYKSDFSSDPTINSYLKFLSKYKKNFNKGIFLDLGCGVAATSALLAKKGISIVGTDISHSALVKSKKLFNDLKLKGDFFQANLTNLPFRDESIIFVYSCMSLEYVKDTETAVREIERVLKPGGKILAIVPAVSLTTLTYHQLRGDIPNIPVISQLSEWIHLKVLKGKYMHYGFEKSFTGGDLKKIFADSGFEVNYVDYYPIAYSLKFLPSTTRKLVISLLHFRPLWPLMYIEATKK